MDSSTRDVKTFSNKVRQHFQKHEHSTVRVYHTSAGRHPRFLRTITSKLSASVPSHRVQRGSCRCGKVCVCVCCVSLCVCLHQTAGHVLPPRIHSSALRGGMGSHVHLVPNNWPRSLLPFPPPFFFSFPPWLCPNKSTKSKVQKS